MIISSRQQDIFNNARAEAKAGNEGALKILYQQIEAESGLKLGDPKVTNPWMSKIPKNPLVPSFFTKKNFDLTGLNYIEKNYTAQKLQKMAENALKKGNFNSMNKLSALASIASKPSYNKKDSVNFSRDINEAYKRSLVTKNIEDALPDSLLSTLRESKQKSASNYRRMVRKDTISGSETFDSIVENAGHFLAGGASAVTDIVDMSKDIATFIFANTDYSRINQSVWDALSNFSLTEQITPKDAGNAFTAGKIVAGLLPLLPAKTSLLKQAKSGEFVLSKSRALIEFMKTGGKAAVLNATMGFARGVAEEISDTLNLSQISSKALIASSELTAGAAMFSLFKSGKPPQETQIEIVDSIKEKTIDAAKTVEESAKSSRTIGSDVIIEDGVVKYENKSSSIEAPEFVSINDMNNMSTIVKGDTLLPEFQPDSAALTKMAIFNQQLNVGNSLAEATSKEGYSPATFVFADAANAETLQEFSNSIADSNLSDAQKLQLSFAGDDIVLDAVAIPDNIADASAIYGLEDILSKHNATADFVKEIDALRTKTTLKTLSSILGINEILQEKLDKGEFSSLLRTNLAESYRDLVKSGRKMVSSEVYNELNPKVYKFDKSFPTEVDALRADISSQFESMLNDPMFRQPFETLFGTGINYPETGSPTGTAVSVLKNLAEFKDASGKPIPAFQAIKQLRKDISNPSVNPFGYRKVAPDSALTDKKTAGWARIQREFINKLNETLDGMLERTLSPEEVERYKQTERSFAKLSSQEVGSIEKILYEKNPEKLWKSLVNNEAYGARLLLKALDGVDIDLVREFQKKSRQYTPFYEEDLFKEGIDLDAVNAAELFRSTALLNTYFSRLSSDSTQPVKNIVSSIGRPTDSMKRTTQGFTTQKQRGMLKQLADSVKKRDQAKTELFKAIDMLPDGALKDALSGGNVSNFSQSLKLFTKLLAKKTLGLSKPIIRLIESIGKAIGAESKEITDLNMATDLKNIIDTRSPLMRTALIDSLSKGKK